MSKVEGKKERKKRRRVEVEKTPPLLLACRRRRRQVQNQSFSFFSFKTTHVDPVLFRPEQRRQVLGHGVKRRAGRSSEGRREGELLPRLFERERERAFFVKNPPFLSSVFFLIQ